MIHRIVLDVRQAFRSLRKDPVLAVLGILTLGLGIGANTAIFSVVYSLIFRPLPGAHAPQELVSITLQDTAPFPSNLPYTSYLDYADLDVFDGAMASVLVQAQLGGDGVQPERVAVTLVSPNFFEVLGVLPSQGRAFAGEERESMGAGNVVVISDEFWHSRFGASRSAVGEVLHLNDHPFTVIGVVPPEFKGTSGVLRMSLFVPTTGIDYIIAGGSDILKERARNGNWSVVARLASGVSVADAHAEVEVHAQRLESEYPATQKGQRALVYPEPRVRFEPSGIAYLPPIATAFMLMVAMVLVIACANVANLLLARASRRGHEIALRSVLGASRRGIVRQLLSESFLLALFGAAAGVVVARFILDALSSIRIATDLPIQLDFALDHNVFLYALAIAVVTGFLSGLAPALYATRRDLAQRLREGGRGTGGSGGTVRNLLVVAQVAISLVLLITAALFVQTVRNATRLDMGFEMSNRLVVGMDVTLRNYDEAEGKIFYRDLLARLRALPGVRTAATGAFLPVGFNNDGSDVYIEARVRGADEPPPFVMRNTVDVDYFRTMGMPILEGRSFTLEDDEESPAVAIVNATFAERFWPGESAVGKRFSMVSEEGPFLEVVGTTNTVKFVLPAESPFPGVYLPFAQNYRADQILHLHTEIAPLLLVDSVRGEIRALDAEMPIWDVRTLENHIREGKMVLFDLAAAMVGGFGLIGLVLATVGLYALMTYSVSQRTKELGIRITVGASRNRVLGLVFRHALLLAAAGLAFGLLGSSAMTPSIANLLVGVGPRDPLTFAGVALFLAVLTLSAAFVPAYRACRVDPVTVLRQDQL